MKMKRLLSRGILGPLMLLGTLLVTPLAAGDGTAPTSPAPRPTPGSDDVEGIPLVFTNPPGFELEVNAWQLNEVLRGVRGEGQISLRPTRPGKVAVRFSGSFEIEVSPRSLRTRATLVRYHGSRQQMRVTQRNGRMILLQR